MLKIYMIHVWQNYIYGARFDLLKPYMQRLFVTVFAAVEQLIFNSKISSLCVLAQGYSEMPQMWMKKKVLRQFKVLLASTGTMYTFCAVQLSFRACLYHCDETAKCFVSKNPRKENTCKDGSFQKIKLTDLIHHCEDGESVTSKPSCLQDSLR